VIFAVANSEGADPLRPRTFAGPIANRLRVSFCSVIAQLAATCNLSADHWLAKGSLTRVWPEWVGTLPARVGKRHSSGTTQNLGCTLCQRMIVRHVAYTVVPVVSMLLPAQSPLTYVHSMYGGQWLAKSASAQTVLLCGSYLRRSLLQSDECPRIQKFQGV
jgi:hypothetical protein